MPTRPLPNYLRSARKRACLSQGDLAYLLGCRSGTKLSRYETFARHPALPTVVACVVLFDSEVQELFPLAFVDAERIVLERARALVRGFDGDVPAAKKAFLIAVVERLEEKVTENFPDL